MHYQFRELFNERILPYDRVLNTLKLLTDYNLTFANGNS